MEGVSPHAKGEDREVLETTMGEVREDLGGGGEVRDGIDHWPALHGSPSRTAEDNQATQSRTRSTWDGEALRRSSCDSFHST